MVGIPILGASKSVTLSRRGKAISDEFYSSRRPIPTISEDTGEEERHDGDQRRAYIQYQKEVEATKLMAKGQTKRSIEELEKPGSVLKLPPD